MLVRGSSKPGEGIYEPFSGSGTTIIAAELEERTCYAAELSPAYVDVAVVRWQAFTGTEAVLERTGQGFVRRGVAPIVNAVAESRGVSLTQAQGSAL